MKNKAIIPLISFIILVKANSRCLQDLLPRVPKFYLLEKCQRSTLAVLIKGNFVSQISCERLAIEKKGLAMNFSPPEVLRDLNETQVPKYSCEVLKCAESETGLSLVNDTRYDYYSIYANPLPNINSTCIPGIGMFFIQKKQNFTNAQMECRNRTGILANVMSERRVEAVSQMLTAAAIEVAFIGISSDNGSDYISVTGDSFDCTTYRAWEPGHPKRDRRKYGCVGVTKSRTWRSLSCSVKFASLCELNPGGPYKTGTLFANRNKYDMQRNETNFNSGNDN